MDLLGKQWWVPSVTSGEVARQLRLAEPSPAGTHSSVAAASRGADEDAGAEEKTETTESEQCRSTRE